MMSSKFQERLCYRSMVAAIFIISMIFVIFEQYPLSEYEMGVNQPKTTKLKVFIFYLNICNHILYILIHIFSHQLIYTICALYIFLCRI